MNHMSKTLFLLVCCLGAGSILTGCGGSEAPHSVAGDISRITGTWHYEWISQTVQGAGADTTYRDMIRKPDTLQFFDEYKADSTLFIDYTRTKNDTTFYLQSQCRRSPLPESLHMEQTPTAEITE